MDERCKSAIFVGDDKLCYLFAGSQSDSLNQSSESTSVIYFEKPDCDQTNNPIVVGIYIKILFKNKLNYVKT